MKSPKIICPLERDIILLFFFVCRFILFLFISKMQIVSKHFYFFCFSFYFLFHHPSYLFNLSWNAYKDLSMLGNRLSPHHFPYIFTQKIDMFGKQERNEQQKQKIVGKETKKIKVRKKYYNFEMKHRQLCSPPETKNQK